MVSARERRLLVMCRVFFFLFCLCLYNCFVCVFILFVRFCFVNAFVLCVITLSLLILHAFNCSVMLP